jgi:hypothetical protein
VKYDNQITREEYDALVRGEDTKYRARKTVVDGIVFDSKREATRYTELHALETLGLIQNLQRQKRYLLIPSQKDPDTGKTLERPCYYVADFVYTVAKTGEVVVEDVKGVRTPVYKIKKKLMLERYGIRIKEV